MKKRTRPDWLDDKATFSIYKASEGGLGFKVAQEMLADNGIPARPDFTPYIGQVGICVPRKFARKASKLLFGDP